MRLRERLARRLAPKVYETRDILSIGHDWNPRRMIANCANRCCRWCSPGESRTINAETP